MEQKTGSEFGRRSREGGFSRDTSMGPYGVHECAELDCREPAAANVQWTERGQSTPTGSAYFCPKHGPGAPEAPLFGVKNFEGVRITGWPSGSLSNDAPEVAGAYYPFEGKAEAEAAGEEIFGAYAIIVSLDSSGRPQ